MFHMEHGGGIWSHTKSITALFESSRVLKMSFIEVFFANCSTWNNLMVSFHQKSIVRYLFLFHVEHFYSIYQKITK